MGSNAFNFANAAPNLSGNATVSTFNTNVAMVPNTLTAGNVTVTNDGNGSYSANARAIFQNSEGLTIDNTGILLGANQPWIIHATANAEL